MHLIDEIEKKLAAKFNKRHCVLTGSGTTAIYLLLKALELKDEDCVLVPGTCCFAPAYAVKYAGLRLDFCDISLDDGCLTPDGLESALERNPGIRAVIGVHLYGNVMEMDSIMRICRERNVFFIEDACQAYGSRYKGALCGALGDFSILSFGHTKMLNAGGTGAFLTDKQELASRMKAELNNLKEYDPEIFMSLSKRHSDEYYALMEKTGSSCVGKASFGMLHKEYRSLFIHGIDNNTLSRLNNLIDNEQEIITHRIRLGRLYSELFEDCPDVIPVISGHDPVFWRFSCLIQGLDTGHICSEMRNKGFDISSWYPNLANMFIQDFSRELENADMLERHIVNMWVDETRDDAYVSEICAVLKDLILSGKASAEKEGVHHD